MAQHLIALALVCLLVPAAAAQELIPPKPKPYFDEPAWVHERPPKLTDRFWHARAAPAGTPPQPLKRVRVVDFGDNIVRRHDDGKSGQGAFGSHLGLAVLSGVDVDGNGNKTGRILYREFSMDVPFCGRPPAYDIEANNAVFYGGAAGFFTQDQGGIEEFGINTSEGKNWSFITPDSAGRHRVCGVWLWKKEDFRYGGDEHRVSFDETSLIGLHVMRYFWRLDQVRYVVKDGERFFISEYNFGTQKAQQFWSEKGNADLDPADYGLGPHTQATAGCGVVFGLAPTQTRWAKYDPEAPYDITFDAQKATYETHNFNDVQAVGFYVAKDRWIDEGLAIKWYAFEVLGTVHRPPRPSETLDTALVRGMKDADGKAIPAFHISKFEIPYLLFKRVRRWAVSPQFAFDEFYPYTTLNDGDMGSMDYDPTGRFGPGLLAHGPDEPVTDLTWLDAVLWCNMLSEYEGREPVYYYNTPDFKFPLRQVCARLWGARRNAYFKARIFVKWDADGYRLPTPAEWLAAAGAAAPQTTSAWIGANSGGTTHDVGTRAPNALGIHDMLGNVWEYTWDVGDRYDPTPEGFKARHIVLGGDFNYPAEPWSKQASPYGDEPHKGHFGTGFRVVRRDRGAPPPPLLVPPVPEHIPSWTVEQGRRGKGKKVEVVSGPVLDMVESKEGSYVRSDSSKITVSDSYMARFEVSYAKWKEVYDWAVAAGYVFNYDGDMGSMDYQTWKHRHSPDEPVTGISRADAFVWCNALSQMEGRKPCYYTTDEKTDVLTHASAVRALWSRRSKLFDQPELRILGWRPGVDPNLGYGKEEGGLFDTYGLGQFRAKYGGGMAPSRDYDMRPPGVDWSTDGYRLPTLAEWTVACQAGTKTRYYWGDDPDLDGKASWSWHNSEGRTHPAGRKPSNPRGLHDMLGNVFEYCWGRPNIGKNQSAHETWNPKGIDWGSSQGMEGGSFLDSTIGTSSAYAFIPTGAGNRRPKRDHKTIWNWNAFTYVGLRPVRCKTRTHRRSGSEMPDDVLILDVNLKEPVTPLQGQTHRANLQRTGVFYSKGIVARPSLRWRVKPGGRITSCPLAFRDKVYVGTEAGFLHALDTETGAEKWRNRLAGGPPYRIGSSFWGQVWPSAPTIKDGILYMGSNGGYLYALDIRTGREKWMITGRGITRVSGSPLPAYGAVFAYMTGYGKDSGLMAVHAETGQILTIYRNYFWGGWQRSMSFADGTLLAAGRLVDMRSGSIIGETAGGMNTSVMYDGRVYAVGGWSGRPSAIKAADYRAAAEIYTVQIESADTKYNRTGTTDNALAVWRDRLYFGTRQGYLYCADAMTGRRIWKTKLGARTRCAPSVSTVQGSEQASVYIGCDDGSVWAVNAVTGEKLWSYKTGGMIWMDPWIAEGVLYVASDDGYLYALE